MRIRTKTTLLFLILSLLPLAVVGVIAYQKGKEAIVLNLGHSYHQIAHEAIEKVDRALYAVYHDVKTWARMDLMQELITDDVDGKIAALLMGLGHQYEDFTSIDLVNRKGVVVASSIPTLIGLDLGQNSWLGSVNRDEVQLKDVHYDDISNEWVTTLAFPIKNQYAKQEEVMGMLVAKWKVKGLGHILRADTGERKETYDTNVTLLRGDGLVIYDTALGGTTAFKTNLVNGGLKSARSATKKEEGYLVEPGLQGRELLIGYDHSRGHRDFAGWGWAALVPRDVETAYQPVEKLKALVFGIGGLVAFSVIIISFFMSKRVTHPIVQIARVAGEVSKGKFDEKIHHNAKDEIGALSTAFNKMVSDLKTQRAQLVDKNYVDSIIANMAESLIVVDSKGMIKTVNRATIHLLGYKEVELVGQPLEKILVKESSLSEAWFKNFIGKGLLRAEERTYSSKDGRQIPISFSASVMHNQYDKVEGIICMAQDITKRKEDEVRFNYMAHHDALTTLPNRTVFIDRLGQALSRSSWRKPLVAVLFIDLDHFKRINDTLGHTVGDSLLRAVAKRLMTCVRGGDAIARIGGDEFVVMLVDMARANDVINVTQKIMNVQSKPFMLTGHELYVTPSIGISLYPTDGEDPETLLKNADLAMYRAKEKGRNNYQLYSPELNTKATTRLLLETNLRHALVREEFLLYYQPLVNLKTERIVGMEALLRWQHPDLGLVSPAQFIPLAEETGLIAPIGEWVLRTACVQNKQWQAARLSPGNIAVNVSARQFERGDLVEIIQRVIKETGLDPRFLELELTESIMQTAERTNMVLSELSTMGIRVSIDDFGTGYSSLGYLKQFPISKLKIDQSFVRDMTTDPDDAAIVKTIITLAHSLELKVIAEAVETEEQLTFLRSLKCDEMQGDYFSRPVPAAEATKLLKERRRLIGKDLRLKE